MERFPNPRPLLLSPKMLGLFLFQICQDLEAPGLQFSDATRRTGAGIRGGSETSSLWPTAGAKLLFSNLWCLQLCFFRLRCSGSLSLFGAELSQSDPLPIYIRPGGWIEKQLLLLLLRALIRSMFWSFGACFTSTHRQTMTCCVFVLYKPLKTSPLQKEVWSAKDLEAGKWNYC